MTVRADASVLLQRLSKLEQAISFAPYAMSEVAVQTIGDVSEKALNRLSVRDDQVGFNLALFLQNIAQPGPLEIDGAYGQVGILDVERMGTLEDFERIAQGSLWHEGTGAAATFKARIFDYEAPRAALAREREAVWGDVTPQWWLLNNGYSGSDAYPPVPPSHFIDDAINPEEIDNRTRTVLSKLLEGL